MANADRGSNDVTGAVFSANEPILVQHEQLLPGRQFPPADGAREAFDVIDGVIGRTWRKVRK
jgi:hypothetical protein